jgi:hypothetical protein
VERFLRRLPGMTHERDDDPSGAGPRAIADYAAIGDGRTPALVSRVVYGAAQGACYHVA